MEFSLNEGERLRMPPFFVLLKRQAFGAFPPRHYVADLPFARMSARAFSKTSRASLPKRTK